MKNLDDFLEVERSKIALSVASGELTRDDILEFCKDSRMKSAFIGTSYSPKCSKDKWDKDYLDELVCAAVAESFNEDYLLYLNDVAETVRNQKSRRFSPLFGIMCGVTAAAVAIVIIMILRNSGL